MTRSGWIGAVILFASLMAVSGVVWPELATWRDSPIWSSALAGLTMTYTLLPVGLAGWCAWQAWRQRRARAYAITATRSPALIMLDWFAPALVASALVPLISVAWIGPQLAGRPRALDLVLIPVSSLLLLSWSLLGAVAGRLLPVALAVPCAMIAALCGLAFPEAMSSFVPRQVLAVQSGCCRVETVIEPRAVLAPLLFYAVTSVTLLLVVIWPRWWRVLIAGVVIAATFAGTGTLVLSISTPEGVRPRSASDLQCQGSVPAVCLWPEQARLRPAVTPIAEQVWSTAVTLGWQPPEAMQAVDGAEWQFAAGTRQRSEAAHRRSVVFGLAATPFPACASSQPWHMSQALEDLGTYLWLKTGYPADQVTQSAVIATVMGLPEPKQRVWFVANMTTRDRCGVRPTAP